MWTQRMEREAQEIARAQEEGRPMFVNQSPDNKAWTHTVTGPDAVPTVRVSLRLHTEDGTKTFMLDAATAGWIGTELLRESARAAEENIALARKRVTS